MKGKMQIKRRRTGNRKPECAVEEEWSKGKWVKKPTMDMDGQTREGEGNELMTRNGAT